MTKSEARLYLPESESESLEEIYEQKLFEWKNFFVNRFPVSKLYQKKIEQLKLLQTAFNVLSEEKPAESVVGVDFSKSFDSNLKLAFHQYAQGRNAIKARLFAARSAEEIAFCAESLLEITRSYARVWKQSDIDTTGVVVSKEPDPMDLLNALNNAEEIGVEKIGQIDMLPVDHMVKNEAKRLSLWIKMDKDE